MAKQVVCVQCGTQGVPKTETPGSFVIEVFAWLMLILPGILYSLWRVSSRRSVCRACGSSELVPLNSPRGRQLIEQYGAQQS